MLAFMNHSNSPNYNSVTDMMLRDAKKGEEVFEDYRLIENWEVVFPWIKDMV